MIFVVNNSTSSVSDSRRKSSYDSEEEDDGIVIEIIDPRPASGPGEYLSMYQVFLRVYCCFVSLCNVELPLCIPFWYYYIYVILSFSPLPFSPLPNFKATVVCGSLI